MIFVSVFPVILYLYYAIDIDHWISGIYFSNIFGCKYLTSVCVKTVNLML